MFQSSLFDLFMTLTGGVIKKKEAKPDNINLKGKHILLAEDNMMNRMVAEGILQKMGMEIECAENGKIAAEKFTASEERYYNAILMDIQMPVMNGFEATKMIKESKHPDALKIQIIALTANAFA